MQNSQTIRLELIEAVPIVMIHCFAHPKKEDIQSSQEKLLMTLDSSEQALFVVVDLRYNVTLPIGDTVSAALKGIYLHPKLASYLIIGGHQTMRTIANILKRITNRDRFLWFKDENEVCDYIKNQRATNGT